MRIAYFTDTFLPNIYGVVTHIVSSCEGLSSRGHRVIVFAPGPSGQERKPALAGFSVAYLPSFPLPDIFRQKERLSLPIPPGIIDTFFKLKDFAPDVVHIHTPFTAGIIGRFFARNLRVPLVETFHGFLADAEHFKIIGLKKGQRLITPFVWKFLVYGLNETDLVIAPSAFAKKELVKNRVEKEIEVIPNGVDLSIAKVPEENVRRIRKQHKLGEKVVLYVGRLSHEKNVDALVEAFYLLQEKVPTAKLLLVGDGPHGGILRERVRKLGITKKVVFTGFVPHDKLFSRGFYKAGDVFATASKTENHPLTILEAEANGLPIVGVKVAGIPELVSQNGILCSPDDPWELALALEKILLDQKLRRRMGEESKKFVQKFALKNSLDKLEGVYQKVKG